MKYNKYIRTRMRTWILVDFITVEDNSSSYLLSNICLAAGTVLDSILPYLIHADSVK